MASVYDYYREHQSPSNAPKGNGTFWLYAKIDFSKQNMAAADNLKLFKVKDKWLLLRGFTRTLVASDGDATADIGTAAVGQQLDVGNNERSNWNRCCDQHYRRRLHLLRMSRSDRDFRYHRSYDRSVRWPC